MSLKSSRSLFPRDVLLLVSARTERAAFFSLRCDPGKAGETWLGCVVQCTHPPSPVWEWGRTRACHGKGRVWRHPPAQELQNKEQLLQMLLRGVSCFLPVPSFMSCLSCVSSQAMAVSSQHLIPPTAAPQHYRSKTGDCSCSLAVQMVWALSCSSSPSS